MFNVRVESAADRDRRQRHTRKTRSFGAALVAFTVVAPAFWEPSSSDPLRPVFALFAMSRDEEGPFMANVRRGNRLRVDGITSNNSGHPMEFLKSAGYDMKPQRSPAGTLVEVFLRDLYDFVPGMIPDEVRFIISAPLAKLHQEAASLPGDGLADLLREQPTKNRDGNFRYDPATVLAEARHFAAKLNQYTLVPLLSEPLFGVQILLSALHRGYVVRDERGRYDTTNDTWSPYDHSRFCEVGMAPAKRAPGLLCAMSQPGIAAWLAEEVSVFLSRKGQTRVGILAEVASYAASLAGQDGAPTERSKAFQQAYEDARLLGGRLGRQAFDEARRAVESSGD